MNDPHDILDEFRLGLESFAHSRPEYAWPTALTALICRLTQRVAALPRPTPAIICTPVTSSETPIAANNTYAHFRQPPEKKKIRPANARTCCSVYRSDGVKYVSMSEAARENNTYRDLMRKAVRHGTAIHGYHFTDKAPIDQNRVQN